MEQSLVKGQLFICQCSQKICKILISMEAYPINTFIQYQAWLNYFLGKILWAYTSPLQFLKVNATLFEDVDWIHGLEIGINVEVEVELPCGDRLWELPVFIWERYADLNQLQTVDVLLNSQVFTLLNKCQFKYDYIWILVVLGVIAVYNSGKFSVLYDQHNKTWTTYHCDIRVFFKQFGDERKLCLKVLKIYIFNTCNFVDLFFLRDRRELIFPSYLCSSLCQWRA